MIHVNTYMYMYVCMVGTLDNGTMILHNEWWCMSLCICYYLEETGCGLFTFLVSLSQVDGLL